MSYVLHTMSKPSSWLPTLPCIHTASTNSTRNYIHLHLHVYKSNSVPCATNTQSPLNNFLCKLKPLGVHFVPLLFAYARCYELYSYTLTHTHTNVMGRFCTEIKSSFSPRHLHQSQGVPFAHQNACVITFFIWIECSQQHSFTVHKMLPLVCVKHP